MDTNTLIEKYPHLKNEIETARKMQETSSSLQAKALYKEKQSTINSLIPVIIDAVRLWDEAKIRYNVTKLEILRDELVSIENNGRAYDNLVDQINNGDFDKEIDEEE